MADRNNLVAGIYWSSNIQLNKSGLFDAAKNDLGLVAQALFGLT